jgi:hypothetical protein
VNGHIETPAAIADRPLPAQVVTDPTPQNEPSSLPSQPPKIEAAGDGKEVPKIRAVSYGKEPPKKRKRKPARIKNFYWRADSAGFELRRSRDDADVARLSGKRWDEMKAKHKGANLTAVVTEWAQWQIARKGM